MSRVRAGLSGMAWCGVLVLQLWQQPVCAQYNTWLYYLPYTLGTGLLWPLRGLLTAPYGSTSYLNQIGAPYGRYYYPTNYGRFYAPQPVQNGYVYSTWQQAPDGALMIDPNTGNKLPPPLAPPHGIAPDAQGWQRTPVASPVQQPLPAAPPNSAPLAAGFVQTVNERFGGDIGKALFDSKTRNWAKTLGLVNDDEVFNADLSGSRVEIVRGIFRDRSLDPLSKLDAAKIVLRGTPVGVKVAGSK